MTCRRHNVETSRRHRTVRVFRVGVGWWSRCRDCPYTSAPGPAVETARAFGYDHERSPDDTDAFRLVRSTAEGTRQKLARWVAEGRVSAEVAEAMASGASDSAAGRRPAVVHVQLQGGPLDGAVGTAPVLDGGTPPDVLTAPDIPGAYAYMRGANWPGEPEVYRWRTG